MGACFETFSTTADVGIHVNGRGFQDFFNCALKGLNALYYGDQLPDLSNQPPVRIHFEYRGDSCENILVNLLSEIVFLMQNRDMLTTSIDVKEADETYLNAELLTIPSPEGAELEIKSVTYHNLKVEERDGIKSASIIFDI